MSKPKTKSPTSNPKINPAPRAPDPVKDSGDVKQKASQPPAPKPKPAPAYPRWVRAKKPGTYGKKYRDTGATFQISKAGDFSKAWMEYVDESKVAEIVSESPANNPTRDETPI